LSAGVGRLKKLRSGAALPRSQWWFDQTGIGDGDAQRLSIRRRSQG